MNRVKTSQGVEIRWWEPFLDHQWYIAYCNLCPWRSTRIRRSMGRAREDCHRHNHGAHQAVAS